MPDSVKIQCGLCRAIVDLTDFRPSANGIDVGCSACGGRFFVPAPGGDGAPAAAPAAAPGASFTCPSCGRAQPESAACRFCGLAFAGRTPDAGVAAGDDEARRLFAAAEERWDDEARHEAFVQYCAGAQRLPFAARCYRERLRRDPADEVARRGQQRVVTVAELTYLTPAGARRDAPLGHRGLLIGAVVLLFLAFLGLVLWYWR